MATKKHKYFEVTSKSDKTTTFKPAGLETDGEDFFGITIPGMFPKANPKMLKPEITYISLIEKEALFKDASFKSMCDAGIYKFKGILFKDMPKDFQRKYDLKLYNQQDSKKSG